MKKLAAILLLIVVAACGESDPDNNTSNNSTSGNATTNNSTSSNATTNNATTNNATTNNTTTTVPNVDPGSCEADEKYVITCQCGPANGCSGEVGRCLKTCETADDCQGGICNDDGVCQQLCG